MLVFIGLAGWLMWHFFPLPCAKLSANYRRSLTAAHAIAHLPACTVHQASLPCFSPFLTCWLSSITRGAYCAVCYTSRVNLAVFLLLSLPLSSAYTRHLGVAANPLV